MDVIEELSYEIIRPAINLSIWLIPWDNLQNIIDSGRIKQIISNYMPINPDESYVVEDKRRYFGKLWCKTGDYITNGAIWEFIVNGVPQHGLYNKDGIVTYLYRRFGDISVFKCGGFRIGNYTVFDDCILYNCRNYYEDDINICDLECIILKNGIYAFISCDVYNLKEKTGYNLGYLQYMNGKPGVGSRYINDYPIPYDLDSRLWNNTRKLKKSPTFTGPKIVGYYPEPAVRHFTPREIVMNKPKYEDIVIRKIDKVFFDS